jgi:hypothetical protein
VEARKLAGAASEILAAMGAGHPDGAHPKAKHELLESTVELITGICTTAAEARADLEATLGELERHLEPRGLTAMCASISPASGLGDRTGVRPRVPGVTAGTCAVPTLTLRPHQVFNRGRTGVAYAELGELVERDMLDPGAAAFLRAAVRARQSIVFAGAPGAGKTTLLSCCAAELDPSLRVVVAEEVFEIDVPLPNVGSMQTRPARGDRPEVDLRRLVSGFLRMAPDVAIVGEVRDREDLPEVRAHSRQAA